MTALTLVIASNNENKVIEIRKILKDFPFPIMTYKEFLGQHIDVLEDGKSFEENAIKKVMAFPEREDVIYLGEDSGLVVDALGGAPGIYSARYAGRETSYPEKCQKIVEELAALEDKEQRTARFVAVAALRFPDGTLDCYEGVIEGQIATEYRGDHGFGYDPIFIPETETKTFGELDEEAKHQLSHRFRALEKVQAGTIQRWIRST